MESREIEKEVNRIIFTMSAIKIDDTANIYYEMDDVTNALRKYLSLPPSKEVVSDEEIEIFLNKYPTNGVADPENYFKKDVLIMMKHFVSRLSNVTDKSEAVELLNAVEFGFKQCEQGNNLDYTINKFNSIFKQSKTK